MVDLNKPVIKKKLIYNIEEVPSSIKKISLKLNDNNIIKKNIKNNLKINQSKETSSKKIIIYPSKKNKSFHYSKRKRSSNDYMKKIYSMRERKKTYYAYITSNLKEKKTTYFNNSSKYKEKNDKYKTRFDLLMKKLEKKINPNILDKVKKREISEKKDIKKIYKHFKKNKMNTILSKYTLKKKTKSNLKKSLYISNRYNLSKSLKKQANKPKKTSNKVLNISKFSQKYSKDFFLSKGSKDLKSDLNFEFKNSLFTSTK